MNNLYKDVLDDLRIAYAQDRQWWRVDRMRADWLTMTPDTETVERAYRDFEAEIKPFETVLNPVLNMDGIALEKATSDHYIATILVDGGPSGLPFHIHHDRQSLNEPGCHWYVERSPHTCVWFRSFDLALAFVRSQVAILVELRAAIKELKARVSDFTPGSDERFAEQQAVITALKERAIEAGL
jgi:hypothetical protein